MQRIDTDKLVDVVTGYSPATGALVIHARHASDEPRSFRRLFIRTAANPSYDQLVPLADGEDVYSMFVSQAAPYVYFTTIIWDQRGGDPGGVYRCDLRDRTVTEVWTFETPDEPSASWIVGEDINAGILFVRGLWMHAATDAGRQAVYAVGALNVASGEMRLLMELDHVFY